MSDPHESEEATRAGGSAVRLDEPSSTDGTTASGHDADDAETEPSSAKSTTSTTSTEHDSDDEHATESESETVESEDDDDETVVSHDDDEDDEDEDEDDDDHGGSSRTGLFVAIGVAAVAVIAVLVLLAAFVWPGFAGPGKPDNAANEAVAALGAKDAGRLDQVGCKRSDGKPTTQLPPEILQLVQSATPSGPPLQTLDSEARQPMNLTLSAQGQTQTLPAEIVLAVNHGSWCMNGIAGRQ